ncbi:TIGR02594 family protein [Sulfitobacter pacificus]|uniref:Peptidoglycan binding-like domain-containing protein n=1 Tax=Sulfitobacter pacificus TaxID=1499314 RepID=A0ABQ5VGD1_9RHOB|nr:TIGR02594 family protein [Sulfitobacter pacificus]GLQ26148.1 hypothetical protein GCM10007927_09510 [Sulfitobacter pacificus]
MRINLKKVQRRLAELGHYQGRIDGINGPKTEAAIIAFKTSKGLRPRSFLGPITMSALFKGVRPVPARIVTEDGSIKIPTWLRLAYGYLGLKEIKGPRHNAEILTWWERLALPFRNDETPWCAGFANAMILAAGLPIVPKHRAAALGWRWNGYGTRLAGPALGAVMSMERPGRPGSGHMTFVAGRDRNGDIMGLGGNQGNMVSINPYDPWARNAQYHWPEGSAPPHVTGLKTLPLITSAGSKLTNEA